MSAKKLINSLQFVFANIAKQAVRQRITFLSGRQVSLFHFATTQNFIFSYKNYLVKLIKPIYLLVFISLLFISCNSTRLIPENQYLLNKVSIKHDSRKIKKEELESYLKQKPNKEIFRLVKFHLFVYNLVKRGKERKWKTWIENVIGEEPVIWDPYNTNKTVVQFNQYLKNKGYYNAIVTDSVIYKNKKVRINYKITLNEPYKINKINYNINDSVIRDIILNDTINSYLKKKKEIFDVDVLQKERKRITNTLNNLGYYYFSKGSVHYIIDSALNNNKVNITIAVKTSNNNENKTDYTLKSQNKYKIEKVFIIPDYDPALALKDANSYYNNLDTINYKEYIFLYNKKLNIKPDIILQAINIKKDNLYKLSDVEKTKNFLQLLRIFSFININFVENLNLQNSDTLTGNLICYIRLIPFTIQSYSVNLEGTNSSGNFGVAGNINYQNKNLFRGAEILDIKFSGALQIQRSFVEGIEEELSFNTFEYGASARIFFPKFLLPVKTERFFMKYKPKTFVKLSYNLQDRPDYTRSITNMGFGYYWEGNKYITNVINPVEINAIQLTDTTNEFMNSIRGTYLENSYKDFFITESNYSFIFNNQDIKKNRDFVYFRTNAEIGGNILSAYSKLTKRDTVEGSYMVFNNEFAQFVKFNFDFRYYNIIDKNQWLVCRLFAGIGYPYGNSEALPFVKQYFSGGANSIRAWQVRSLGPGSYLDKDLTYPNQSAGLKLEANLEYRFDIFWLLEGAFFIDAGNIWSINKEDDRQGAVFEYKSFYKDIAIGTGIGTRLDFSFFLFRIDFGLKTYDPVKQKGQKWITERKKILWDDWMLNVGIGYPF